MKILIYLLAASVILFVLMFGFLFVETIIEINTVGNRVQDSLTAAGWAGFSKIDMDKLAKRRDMCNEEQRDVYIIKDKAIDEVTNYIKMNLNLDASLHATSDSFIKNTSNPVIIDEIEVYNPDDLPATCSRGATFNRTTIHIVVRIPMDIKFLGFRYLEKHVDVDAKSFYKN